MDSWGVVFLGVIALSSLVQAAFLLGLAREGRRLAQRLEQLQERLDREIRPGLEQFTRLARNFAEISDIAVLQARRIDDLVEDTVEKIEETTSVIRKVILRPLGPVADVVAFLKGLRRGLQVYRQLSGLDSGRRGPAQRYADDEHLFI
jgi:hypothetical protein